MILTAILNIYTQRVLCGELCWNCKIEHLILPFDFDCVVSVLQNYGFDVDGELHQNAIVS